jgi:uncharacterized membrane protein YhaH (DUF805 family)
MLDAVKYGLRNLFNLNGRDARQTFWYFVLLIFIVRMVLGVVVAVPMVIHMFGSIVEVAKTGGTDPAYMRARMMAALADDLPRIMWAGIVISVVSGVALLPSLVRRLHDSDLSGLWVALPGVLYLVALQGAPAQIQRAIMVMVTTDPAHPPNSFQMMQNQGATGLLAYVALGLIIYAGVRKSTPGPNRFGDAPVSF